LNALLLYFADTYRPVRMRFRTLHPRLGARPALSLCRQWLSAALIGRRPQLEPLTPSQSPVGSAKRRFSTPSDAVTIGAISSRRALTPSGSARRIQCLAALVFPSVRRSCRMQSTSGSCPRGIRKPSVSCSQTRCRGESDVSNRCCAFIRHKPLEFPLHCVVGKPTNVAVLLLNGFLMRRRGVRFAKSLSLPTSAR